MNKTFDFQGLSNEEVLLAREKFGQNQLVFKKENRFIDAIKSLLKEPMIALLLVASLIYFISGEYNDAIFLAVAIILVGTISLYQDSRSRNALEKLKDISQPHCKVIRNGQAQEIKSDELVICDYLIVEEGTLISADCSIVYSNDFSVNESILTGESLPVIKDKTKEDNTIYRGTSVATGMAIGKITAIGNNTKLGKIGKSLENIKEEKTPLEQQISSFVKKMVFVGAIVFLIVWGINYFRSFDWLDSLLKALTLAMSILPEEIPVAFTVFMALGAWRLMKMGVVVKQMKTVETLGSATVICTDKTGTITENKMSLARIFALQSTKISTLENNINEDEKHLISIAMWASEPIPFDPMEIALHDAYTKTIEIDERLDFKMIHEYPLGGKPPMMTHIFENKEGKRILAAKGAPEAIIAVSSLSVSEKEQIENAIITLAESGFRVLAVGEAQFDGDMFLIEQQAYNFKLLGIVAFYDPPKKNIREVLKGFYGAGMDVKIVTGDNAATTSAIAKQIDFRGCEASMSGDELMKLNDIELQEKVMDIQIFTRMFPEAKLRIINALKANNQIVAMVGDGVNDGPALKSAHIGIAMGKKGTEIAKQAASLILLEDDLAKMVDAVGMGRKIYTNLKKAIQYIISIHIPIILTVFIPLALGWVYPNIFSPIHIIFLELIMGPTCSIIYENEPMEKNIMEAKPRPFTSTFFNSSELITSVIQGLMITVGILFTYQLAVNQGFDESVVRTMAFSVLISANIFLTLINRSFYYSILTTSLYRNNLVYMIIGITILAVGIMIYSSATANFFGFESLNYKQLGISISIGFLSVIWYELVKLAKRRRF
ncbi:cation-translocating P-type ATPase [Albibacterium bauzanense]|uniref:Ca2+-transporting ATPase n=1 Tax=Albibacterium bauzanense TaxID=653929 RepID=A0A4V2PXS0_9SPHI|nr:cation-translocating P-type ATPase [Albibacterium bauzanense]TCK83141.1 Ca2+-transporting ATPase [Albibacterium bauzanense]